MNGIDIYSTDMINLYITLHFLFVADTGRSRLFVTVPRFQEGIPITLGVVSTSFATNESVLHAYPSYAWQESHGANCDGITSVFRIAVSKLFCALILTF